MRNEWAETPVGGPDGRTTAGEVLQAARRDYEAGRVEDALDSALSAALDLDHHGRPREALSFLEELRSFVSAESAPAELWPWVLNTEGIAASSTGDTARAEAAYEEMRRLAAELPKGERRDDLLATALQNLGILFSESSPEKARELLVESLKLKLGIDDIESALDVFMSLALNARELGNLGEAREMLDEMVRIADELRDPRLQAAAHGNRGGLRAQLGELAGANEDFREALRQSRRYGDPVRIVLGLLNMGSLSADSGDLGSAIRYYRRGARLATEIGAAYEEVRLRRALAAALYGRGRKRDAVAELARAEARARELGDDVLGAEVRADLGALHLQDGDSGAGIAELEQAVTVLEPRLHASALMQAQRNLVEGYRLAGRQSDADALLEALLAETAVDDHAARASLAEEGLAIWTTPPPNGPRAARYLRMRLDALRAFMSPADLAWQAAVGASVLSGVGLAEYALPFYDTALEEARAAEDRQLEWHLRNDQAIALADVGRLDDALSHLDWCVDVAQESEDRVLGERAHANAGEVSRRAGQLERSEQHLEQARLLARELLDREAEASTLGLLGLTVSDAGRWDEARRLFEEALAIGQELGNSKVISSATAGLASAEFEAGNPAVSAELYERAANASSGDPRHEIERLGNALLAWTAAQRVRRLRRIAQRVVDVAQASGEEAFASALFGRVAEYLLDEGKREASLSFYSGALRLAAVEGTRHIPDDQEPSIAQEFRTLLLRVAEMVSASRSAVGVQAAHAFWEDLLRADELSEMSELLRSLFASAERAFDELDSGAGRNL